LAKLAIRLLADGKRGAGHVRNAEGADEFGHPQRWYADRFTRVG
jgi:hypothetical protein